MKLDLEYNCGTDHGSNDTSITITAQAKLSEAKSLMFKILYILVVFIAVTILTSDIKLDGSLFKAEDNVFMIQFPKAEWKDTPIFYMHCQPEGGKDKDGNPIEGGCRFKKDYGDGNEKKEHFQGF